MRNVFWADVRKYFYIMLTFHSGTFVTKHIFPRSSELKKGGQNFKYTHLRANAHRQFREQNVYKIKRFERTNDFEMQSLKNM